MNEDIQSNNSNGTLFVSSRHVETCTLYPGKGQCQNLTGQVVTEEGQYAYQTMRPDKLNTTKPSTSLISFLRVVISKKSHVGPCRAIGPYMT